ncbi:hypothetical protein [Pelagibaculum spongiae]|uniref:Lipoprotein n=1 Tax=Pelagibaculum spongiae TaxID=2080658 RepID=A0A2V1H2X2_9GAMM|nr:hypothetical protein [Pelagibaculum spongiae]PVZ69647.1 hypothetical protein DC094_10100 [Pelagibaculum spongiae]
MKKSIIISTILIGLAVGGCSQSTPKCGSDDATDLVKEISGREMAAQLGSEAAKLISYSVNAIRTTHEDNATGSYDCAAQLGITASNTGITNEIPITYTVERTDDGEQFFVNVFGL